MSLRRPTAGGESGGWDTEGPCSFIGATEEQLREEVRRNMETYGKNGGFILVPVLLNEKGNSMMVGTTACLR